MKSFKFIGMALVAILMGMNLASCSSENDVITTEPETETVAPKEYIVSLGWKGEIVDITESPLATRAAKNNDLYGIQVYSSPNKQGIYEGYAKYAYGLFDDVGKITIKLLDGYKYKFVATMIVDGKNKLTSYPSADDSNIIYFGPFGTSITNTFKYNTVDYLGGLNWSDRSSLDRYYGELEDYVPSDNGIANIKMKRTSFGIKIIATEMTEGKLTVKIDNSTNMNIIYPATEAQELFSLQNLQSAWNYELPWMHPDTGEYLPSENTYSERIPISFTWTKDDGVELPLGTQTINFKRNKLTTITIIVVESSSKNDIGVTYEEKGDMEDGETVVIDPGSSTDNEVNPQP